MCVLEPVRECLAAELKHTAYGGRSFFSRVQGERGEAPAESLVYRGAAGEVGRGEGVDAHASLLSDAL